MMLISHAQSLGEKVVTTQQREPEVEMLADRLDGVNPA